MLVYKGLKICSLVHNFSIIHSEKKKQHRLLNNKLSTEHFQLQHSTETMEGTVSVKAYLDASGQNPEIRRFELDSDVSTNFEYLRSKVASIFPSLNQQGFKVFWKGKLLSTK